MTGRYELAVYLETKEKSYTDFKLSAAIDSNKQQFEKYIFLTEENRDEYDVPDFINLLSLNNDGSIKDIYEVPVKNDNPNIDQSLSADEVHIKYDVNDPDTVLDINNIYFRKEMQPSDFKNKIIGLYSDIFNDNDLIIISRLFGLVPETKWVLVRSQREKKFYIANATDAQLDEFLKMDLNEGDISEISKELPTIDIKRCYTCKWGLIDDCIDNFECTKKDISVTINCFCKEWEKK